ncbi:uncharacterized protein BYT42DRAFT_516497 [Radiomyces spectabilis]|uniref:uncharacterized protein n=1 Tax=Radiomyces spectabilis TaxID=64574 RepID=UPI00221FC217|nr:uncharacterized protein BYT42DRAFT_516497 [Radiomyces spectabilis]KAI8378068.1 hypothetical protein BYT42DRAFT_516497 [Radiomyces spectabilis]
MAEKYKNFKVKELQELLQNNGIPHTGKKEELIERLVKHDQRKAFELESLEEEFGNLEDFDPSKLNLDEFTQDDPEFRSLTNEVKPTTTSSQSNKTAAQPKEEPANSTPTTETTTTLTSEKPAAAAAAASPTAKAAATNGETPEKKQSDESNPVTKEGSNFKFTPITFDAPAKKESASPVKMTSPQPSSPSGKTEVEKRLERAKRFGVELSDKAKAELRAQRFGLPTKSTAPAKGANKGLDPEVLKKRAERFGIPAKGNKEAKSSPTLDAAEEEKKRKRAERFGMTPDAKKAKK